MKVSFFLLIGKFQLVIADRNYDAFCTDLFVFLRVLRLPEFRNNNVKLNLKALSNTSATTFYSLAYKIKCSLVYIRIWSFNSIKTTKKMARNFTSDETSESLYRMQKELKSRSHAIFVLENVVFSIGEATTIIGNFLVLFIILRSHNLRVNITNMLIISLLVSGFLNGLLVVPISHAVLATSKWPFSNSFCQFQGFMAVFLGTTALLTLAIISVSRFYSVVKNSLYRRYFTLRTTVLMLVLAWILGISAPMLYLATGHRYIFIPAKVLCYIPVKTSWFLLILAVFYVGLPSFIVIFCYLRIFLAVRKHTTNFVASANNKSLNAQDINITWVMFIVVVCFSICWFPVLLIELIDIFQGKWSLPRAVYVVFTLFGGLSNALNPIIYGIMNYSLKKELIKMFNCDPKSICNRKRSLGKPIRISVQPTNVTTL